MRHVIEKITSQTRAAIGRVEVVLVLGVSRADIG
jgi:hypothetical protein